MSKEIKEMSAEHRHVMEAMAQNIGNRPSRLWAIPRSIVPSALALLVVLLALAWAGPAAAAGPFDGIGQKLGSALCSFAQSPIVIVLAGAAFVGLFILMLTNEDKGILSTMLKIIVAALAIYNIVSIVTWLGIGSISCGTI